MAWRNALNFQSGTKTTIPYTPLRPFKISAEEDASDTDYTGITDLYKDNANLMRVATKRFVNNNNANGVPVVYVHLMKFKYDRDNNNYMKQAQVSYTLEQFKALQENIAKVDELIDGAFTHGNSKERLDNDNSAEPRGTSSQKQETENIYQYYY